jgi:hypothetical protein
MKLAGIAYVTPTFRFDSEAKVVVVQFRNTDTGEITKQTPTDRELRQRADEVSVSRAASAAQPAEPAVPPARIVAAVAVPPPGAKGQAPAEAPAPAPAKVSIEV